MRLANEVQPLSSIKRGKSAAPIVDQEVERSAETPDRGYRDHHGNGTGASRGSFHCFQIRWWSCPMVHPYLSFHETSLGKKLIKDKHTLKGNCTNALCVNDAPFVEVVYAALLSPPDRKCDAMV